MAFINDDQLIKDNKQFSQWAIVLSSIVFVLIALDIVGDYRDGVPWSHLFVEVLILTLSLAGIVYFGRLYYQFANTGFGIGKPSSPTMA